MAEPLPSAAIVMVTISPGVMDHHGMHSMLETGTQTVLIIVAEVKTSLCCLQAMVSSALQDKVIGVKLLQGFLTSSTTLTRLPLFPAKVRLLLPLYLDLTRVVLLEKR